MTKWKKGIIVLIILGLYLIFRYGGVFWYFIPLMMALYFILKAYAAFADIWRQYRTDTPLIESKYGVYFLDILHPSTGETTHGKLGHGNVDQRISQHHTVSGPLRVRGVIYTDTKSTAQQLEQRIKNELESAGQIIPYDGKENRAIETFYPSKKAYEIIDGTLEKVGVTPNDNYRLAS